MEGAGAATLPCRSEENVTVGRPGIRAATSAVVMPRLYPGHDNRGAG